METIIGFVAGYLTGNKDGRAGLVIRLVSEALADKETSRAA